MTTKDTATAEDKFGPTEEDEGVTIYATLIRGRYHDFNGKVWDKNAINTHKVTMAEMNWLAAHAVDRKTVDDQEEVIPRFEFSDEPPEDAISTKEEAEEAAAPAPRIRRRSV